MYWKNALPLSDLTGKWAFVMTATHYFCGVVEEVQEGVVVLAEDSVIVYKTGAVEAMLRDGVVDDMDHLPVRTRLLVGGMVAVLDWPHKRIPHLAAKPVKEVGKATA